MESGTLGADRDHNPCQLYSLQKNKRRQIASSCLIFTSYALGFVCSGTRTAPMCDCSDFRYKMDKTKLPLLILFHEVSVLVLGF